MICERVQSGYTDWDIITIADISRLANKSTYGQSKIASNLFSQVCAITLSISVTEVLLAFENQCSFHFSCI